MSQNDLEAMSATGFPAERCANAYASVVKVDADRLAQMLPSLGVRMQYEPIRFCGACSR
ncbi:hypothetical protein [Nostoc sp. CENA543]|uniref:hypothetical protein n=1 Tax=Nostoc sp. CENA543 TaxID=1869241 RepID=UPI001CEF88AA|nr:hypothetical protein [Nostoc sp. CENA543]